MVVLGLLLLLLAALVVAVVFVRAVRDVLVDVGVDRLLTDPPPPVAFGLGVLAGALAVAGLWLIVAARRRGRGPR